MDIEGVILADHGHRGGSYGVIVPLIFCPANVPQAHFRGINV